MNAEDSLKVKTVAGEGAVSAWRKYRGLYYGETPLVKIILCEMVMALCGSMYGAMGLFLRSRLFPPFFAAVGRGVVFGRNLTIRHPRRIRLGNNVIIDDNCVLDAKGVTNRGIAIGDNVYIGRNTIVYCKNGNIAIGDNVNISSNCQFVSSNDMTIGADTVIGAYSYLLSGGGYDYTPGAKKFSEQDGYITVGPLVIGDNCWLGARVAILDGASVGTRSVIAAGAVVTKPVPPDSVAGGIPAHVIKPIT